MCLEERGLRGPSAHREGRRQWGREQGSVEQLLLPHGHLSRLSSPLRLLSQGTGLWGAWSTLSYLVELQSPPWGTVLLRKQPCVDSHRSINEF